MKVLLTSALAYMRCTQQALLFEQAGGQPPEISAEMFFIISGLYRENFIDAAERWRREF